LGGSDDTVCQGRRRRQHVRPRAVARRTKV